LTMVSPVFWRETLLPNLGQEEGHFFSFRILTSA
jgi:hypothetical protein